MNLYFPGFITSAFGGVENGEAKHILAPTVTAMRNGYGLTSIAAADWNAIGATNTAVAVLLINIVNKEVVR